MPNGFDGVGVTPCRRCGRSCVLRFGLVLSRLGAGQVGRYERRHDAESRRPVDSPADPTVVGFDRVFESSGRCVKRRFRRTRRDHARTTERQARAAAAAGGGFRGATLVGRIMMRSNADAPIDPARRGASM